MHARVFELMLCRRSCLIGHIDFAESRQNRVQQLVFVLYNDEEARIVTKQFNTPAQGALGVNGEFIGIHQDDTFEHIVVITLHVCFGEIFEFVADEFDALAVGAIHKHDIGLDAIAVESVDLIYEIADDGAFSDAGRTVKNEIRNFPNRDKIIQLFHNIFIFGMHLLNNREMIDFLYYFLSFGCFAPFPGFFIGTP